MTDTFHITLRHALHGPTEPRLLLGAPHPTIAAARQHMDDLRRHHPAWPEMQIWRCHAAWTPVTVVEAETVTAIPPGENAEDCPRCDPRDPAVVVYPWICPGHPEPVAAEPEQPADTIRRAADLIRTRAAAATCGPWLSMDGGDRLVHDPGHDYDPPEYVVDEPMSNAANAEHIAGMDPLVAVAVANVLEQLARIVDVHGFYETSAAALALELARTYLGREA